MKKILIISSAFLISSCAAQDTLMNKSSSKVIHQRVSASYYGNESGSHTANGERWKPNGLTAAHRTLPFGSRVRVTNLNNGKAVHVRINDRGPASWTGRHIDLSKGGAHKIGMVQSGTAVVKVERIYNEGF